tara:strand:+ start:394 stop:636 length:243 start_codon:yes stop_codon:yes gene_type:complete
MEELLNSKYTIKELGNTWLSNGTVYQSFLGSPVGSNSAKEEVPKEKPKVTKDTPVTKRPVETKAPTTKKKKKTNVTKETK